MQKKQGNKLMMLIELSDLIGAVEWYLDQQYNGKINLNDLQIMSKVTKRAFKSGYRK